MSRLSAKYPNRFAYVRVEVMPDRETERWLRRRGIRVICPSIVDRYSEAMVRGADLSMSIVDLFKGRP